MLTEEGRDLDQTPALPECCKTLPQLICKGSNDVCFAE